MVRAQSEDVIVPASKLQIAIVEACSSRAALAREMRVSVRTVDRWIMGIVPLRAGTMQRALEALGLPAAWRPARSGKARSRAWGTPQDIVPPAWLGIAMAVAGMHGGELGARVGLDKTTISKHRTGRIILRRARWVAMLAALGLPDAWTPTTAQLEQARLEARARRRAR